MEKSSLLISTPPVGRLWQIQSRTPMMRGPVLASVECVEMLMDAGVKVLEHDPDDLSSISIVTPYNINEVNFPVVKYAPETCPAPLADCGEEPIPVLFDEGTYKVSVSAKEYGEYDASISVENLKKHTNGAGTNGYWVGVSVIAPEGATQFKVALGFKPATKLSEPMPLEEAVDGKSAKGVGLYLDAEKASTGYAVVYWLDEMGADKGKASFTIDMTGVIKLPENDKI